MGKNLLNIGFVFLIVWGFSIPMVGFPGLIFGGLMLYLLNK